MEAKTKIEQIPGIGKYYSYKLSKLGIETLEDLIYHFPFRYDDYSKKATVANITPGENVSITGSVWLIKNIRTRNGKFLTIATVSDESGTIEIIWFNQPYLTKSIKTGSILSLSGKTELDQHKLKMISPSYEIITSSNRDNIDYSKNQNDTLHTARLVPVYPETEGLTSKWIRTKISKVLSFYLAKSKDFLPNKIIKKNNLIPLNNALNNIHFPKNISNVNKAKERLSFDELLIINLQAQIRKAQWNTTKKAPKLKTDSKKLNDFISSLPFTLTTSQSNAIDQILKDFNSQTPANRLLEGDVGSGKTVIAAAACYISSINGYHSIFAAPTEILAFQHKKTLDDLLSPFNISVGIWTKSKKEKGEVTCGTHALLDSFSSSNPVGFVVVDEQHRFGVAQRTKLFTGHKQKKVPHLLTMTATPIPRTLALTLFADLNLSVLDEMPKDRKKISTHVVPNKKRNDAYKFIEKNVLKGQQAFIVTPFVETSETLTAVKAATTEFEKLQTIFSKKINLSLLHGRLKSKEKEKVINDFKNHKTNILVTTPVVEVGIDVPNASIIVIESAERFGLAQLHQLRGRVGRGNQKSYCLLFSDSQSEVSQKRLKSLEIVHIGFKLAEIDLKLRGPGEVYGYKQSGYSSLKIANIFDKKLIAKVSSEAQYILKTDPDLKFYKLLQEKLDSIMKTHIQPN